MLDRGEGLPVKVWWVLADSGAILISLGDPQQDVRRLDAAATVACLAHLSSDPVLTASSRRAFLSFRFRIE